MGTIVGLSIGSATALLFGLVLACMGPSRRLEARYFGALALVLALVGTLIMVLYSGTWPVWAWVSAGLALAGLLVALWPLRRSG